jgi:hypothetical protein
MIPQSGLNRLVTQPRHVLSQCCYLSVLASREPPKVMRRKVVYAYRFGSRFQRVVEYAIMKVAASANGSEQ